MASQEENEDVKVIPADKSKIKKIWMTALILAVVTGIEFIFAFTLPRGFALVAIFVILTFVKAFYIVGEFMHLKHEVKSLIYSIVLPAVFIFWLILALLIEGDEILQALRTFWYR